MLGNGIVLKIHGVTHVLHTVTSNVSKNDNYVKELMIFVVVD